MDQNGPWPLCSLSDMEHLAEQGLLFSCIELQKRCWCPEFVWHFVVQCGTATACGNVWQNDQNDDCNLLHSSCDLIGASFCSSPGPGVSLLEEAVNPVKITFYIFWPTIFDNTKMQERTVFSQRSQSGFESSCIPYHSMLFQFFPTLQCQYDEVKIFKTLWKPCYSIILCYSCLPFPQLHGASFWSRVAGLSLWNELSSCQAELWGTCRLHSWGSFRLL